ncbi:uncharacterized protein FA14DRAFT_156975 [Meira miltonrushii]|uniref:BHLH domain-containing protein n=1 Tax=Meira miltonrushii TaxID=1280837 RepID=A0A316V9M0_9BASI|nr:uncharacterized protein FA14DRAFT_156975 [Meira miltonrushii]PWN34309.1 hypothetical protein FA14DRAFT_156975 [Meira miltonrushii]
MTTAEPSSSSSAGPSAPSTSSLFNSDEARFMSDSFCSAESFDPFTVGAPGFKVPNVLPANIGGMGSAPGTNENGGEANPSLAGISNVAFSNENDVNSTTASRGGYGQNKAYQLRQLEALQAERFKYLSSNPKQDQSPNAPQSQFSHRHSLAGPSSLPDTSTIGHSLYGDGGPDAWAQFMSNAQQSNGALPAGMSGLSSNSVQHPVTSQSGDLSDLGARFPSSHQFPGSGNMGHLQNHRPASFPYFQQQHQMPGQFVPNQTWNGIPAQDGMNSSGGESGKSKKSGNPKTKMTQSQSASSELDGTYTFTPAPRPPLPVLDVEKVAQSNVIPPNLQEAFFSPSLKRLQPHLKDLREEQMKRKAQGLSANIRKDRKDAKQTQGGRGGTSADDDEDAEEGTGSGKKKQSHVLLTEAEKKANHIASEQKRRANIRKGYELLCSLVPSLRESMDEDGGDEEEDDEDDEDDAEEGDTKRGKKRKPGDGGGGGGNVDSKSGPRSEAMILMKVVDHIHGKIDEHNALVIKKQELQKELAKRYGADPSLFF